MRIIAGAAKGTRLGPVPPGTRPMSDMAREGLFASLGAAVEGARCLDLFAGTGAVGIEAWSRGATEVVFVERSTKAIGSIRDNIARAHASEGLEVVRAEVGAWLTRHAAAQGVFDIVVLRSAVRRLRPTSGPTSSARSTRDGLPRRAGP